MRRWTPRWPAPARAGRSWRSRAGRDRQDRTARGRRAARPREAGMRVLHARASELEQDVHLRCRAPAVRAGAVRARRGGAQRDPLGSRGAARPHAARCSRRGAGTSRSPPTRRLHGLYWLCANLAAERRCWSASTTPSGRTSRACASSASSLPRLEDAAASRSCSARARAPSRRPTVLRALVTDPGDARPAPARADRRRPWRSGCARRSTSRRAETASAPPATRPPAATRSWCASCCTRCSRQAADGDRRRGRRGARARARRRSRPSCCSA